ncbi:MAG: hypothetical protein ACRCUS_00055 [Anaerovoracaceae bacterium]
MTSIRNLDWLLTTALGYLGFISEKYEEIESVLQLIEISKRIYEVTIFVFYAIADGIFRTFSKCKLGIIDMLIKKQNLYSFLCLKILCLLGLKNEGNQKLIEVENANGDVVKYGYESIGRKNKITYTSGKEVKFV